MIARHHESMAPGRTMMSDQDNDDFATQFSSPPTAGPETVWLSTNAGDSPRPYVALRSDAPSGVPPPEAISGQGTGRYRILGVYLASANNPQFTNCRIENCTGSAAACPADVVAPDTDGDTVCDPIDGCPLIPDPLQPDGDGDGENDACDACTNIIPIFADRHSVILSRILAPGGAIWRQSGPPRGPRNLAAKDIWP